MKRNEIRREEEKYVSQELGFGGKGGSFSGQKGLSKFSTVVTWHRLFFLVVQNKNSK